MKLTLILLRAGIAFFQNDDVNDNTLYYFGKGSPRQISNKVDSWRKDGLFKYFTNSHKFNDKEFGELESFEVRRIESVEPI